MKQPDAPDLSRFTNGYRTDVALDFSGSDLLKREFTGAGGDDADALARLESGVFEPMAAQADFRLDLVKPEIAAGFDLEGALLVLMHAEKKESRLKLSWFIVIMIVTSGFEQREAAVEDDDFRLILPFAFAFVARRSDPTFQFHVQSLIALHEQALGFRRGIEQRAGHIIDAILLAFLPAAAGFKREAHDLPVGAMDDGFAGELPS